LTVGAALEDQTLRAKFQNSRPSPPSQKRSVVLQSFSLVYHDDDPHIHFHRQPSTPSGHKNQFDSRCRHTEIANFLSNKKNMDQNDKNSKPSWPNCSVVDCSWLKDLEKTPGEEGFFSEVRQVTSRIGHSEEAMNARNNLWCGCRGIVSRIHD
jgi:hypothetical protein